MRSRPAGNPCANPALAPAIPLWMDGLPQELEEPFRELRKSLRKSPKNLSPGKVHKLRTRIRRMESLLHAWMPEKSRKRQHLLNTLKPLHKKAGRVRDYDVWIAFVASLHPQHQEERQAMLLEQLSTGREHRARQLIRKLRKARSSALQQLDDCCQWIARHNANKPHQQKLKHHATAAANAVATEISAWPALNLENLHAFRLKTKELRYMLQLEPTRDQNRNKALLTRLGEVKDVIGEWHDWSELLSMATDLLPRKNPHPLLDQIRSTAQQKFQDALSVSQKMRRQTAPAKSSRSAKNNPQQPRATNGWRPVLIPSHLPSADPSPRNLDQAKRARSHR